MNTFRLVMEWIGLMFDAIGVLVIACGALVATSRLIMSGANQRQFVSARSSHLDEAFEV